jgi:hypothetical protein
VVEEVVDAILDVVHIEHPALVGNLNAELVLFVALGGQRREGVLARWAGDVVQHGTGDGLDRRGLEEVAVEAAQDPVQAGNFDGCADARIDGGLVVPAR